MKHKQKVKYISKYKIRPDAYERRKAKLKEKHEFLEQWMEINPNIEKYKKAKEGKDRMRLQQSKMRRKKK